MAKFPLCETCLNYRLPPTCQQPGLTFFSAQFLQHDLLYGLHVLLWITGAPSGEQCKGQLTIRRLQQCLEQCNYVVGVLNKVFIKPIDFCIPKTWKALKLTDLIPPLPSVLLKSAIPWPWSLFLMICCEVIKRTTYTDVSNLRRNYTKALGCLKEHVV